MNNGFSISGMKVVKAYYYSFKEGLGTRLYVMFWVQNMHNNLPLNASNVQNQNILANFNSDIP